MEFTIQDFSGHPLAKGSTSNPYQVRNIISQYITTPTHQLDPHTLHTPFLKIWCSAEIPALLQPTPRILNDSAPGQPPRLPPHGPVVTLKEVCKEYNLDPMRCRRLLRRYYGAAHVRYSWQKSEVPLSVLSR